MYLGIDTSCYTTSIAIVEQDGSIIKDCRKLLNVKQGERGLQQSKAVWQHLNNLPIMISELFTQVEPMKLKSVTVSAKPRPAEEAYLPVFNVGVGFAKTLASSLRIPLHFTTHQEGHLIAGCTEELLNTKEFLAFHLSGGTSELLKITVEDYPFVLAEEILGQTTDLHAGQFVDRVGVALGLAFPSGPSMEQLAQTVTELKVSIPSVVRGLNFSFSGPESCAQRLIISNTDKNQVARAVEQCLANTLRKVIQRAKEQTGLKNILIVGGVSANKYIRNILITKLTPKKINLIFAETALSSDNAVGVALVGRRYRINNH